MRALALVALAAASCGHAAARPPRTAGAGARECPPPQKLPRNFVAVPGGALHYNVFGSNRESSPVVFIHDWAHDSSVFYQQVSALRTRFPVWTYDLRGHGDSSDARGEGASVAGHARDLGVLLDEIGTQPVHLVGQGLGGWIALAFAAEHPQRIASLTLIATTASLAPEVQSRLRQTIDQYREEPSSFHNWADRFPRIWLSRHYLDARPDMIAFFDVMLGRLEPSSVVGTLEKILGYEIAPAELKKITAPTLVLFGEEDRFPGTREAESFFSALPDVTRLRIPGAGHEPQLENPDAFNAALVRHLAAAS